MRAIDAEELGRVVGGKALNTTTMTTPKGTTSSTRTDYAYCADTVRQACRDQNSFLWWTNKRAAGKCTVENLPKVCDRPPQ